MAYRDDREADQARIVALEQELAVANERIASLEGKQSTALVVAAGGSLVRQGDVAARQQRVFGAPLELAMSREFDGAFPVERLEDLLGRIRSISSDPGHAEVLRSSLTWRASSSRQSGPTMAAHVMVKDGKTTLVVTDRLGNLAGGLYGGLGGGLGAGGVMLPVMATLTVPILMPVAIAGWFVGVFGSARAIFKRAARRRAVALQQLFDALVADITAAIAAAR